jgi:hypothetical protein
MPTPALPDNAFYQDGGVSVTDYAVEILNLPTNTPPTIFQQVLYVSDDIGEDAMHEAHVGVDGEGEGSYTGTVDKTGNIVCQLDTSTSTVPSPGFILRFRGELYQVIGKPAQSREKNKTVRVTLPVKKLIHPCLVELLSTVGPVKTVAATSGAAITSIDVNPLSNVSGQTYAFAVGSDFDALPTGVTLNVSTGAISGTPSVTGTFTSKVVCTATKANAPTRTGVAWIKIVVS